MEYTLLKGHRPPYFDGYAAHNHIEIIAMPVANYIKLINGAGLIYPPKEYAGLILNPWRHPWVRQHCRLSGYNWMEDTSGEHPGLYALGDTGSLHDGIDIYPTDDGPSEMVCHVDASRVNANGYKATGVIYRINSEDMLQEGQCWLLDEGRYIRGVLRDGRAYYDDLYRAAQADRGRQDIRWDATSLTAYYEEGTK